MRRTCLPGYRGGSGVDAVAIAAAVLDYAEVMVFEEHSMRSEAFGRLIGELIGVSLFEDVYSLDEAFKQQARN